MSVVYKKRKKKSIDSFNTKITNPGVSIITPTNRLNYMDKILKNYLSQNFEKKELIIVLNNNHMDLKKYKEQVRSYKNIKVFQVDESYRLGECRDYAIKHANLEYIALFDDDDYYGPNYLNQSMRTFNEVETDVVGKASFFTYFEETKKLVLFHHLENENKENIYVRHVCDPTLVFKHSIMEKIKTYPGEQTNPDVIFQDKCKEYGFKIYSNDRFNFVLNRHPNPTKAHTWTSEESEILKKSEIINSNITDYRSLVTE